MAGEIELLFGNIVTEKRGNGETVTMENAMSELVMYKDIDRRPRIVVRKIVERLVNQLNDQLK